MDKVCTVCGADLSKWKNLKFGTADITCTACVFRTMSAKFIKPENLQEEGKKDGTDGTLGEG